MSSPAGTFVYDEQTSRNEHEVGSDHASPRVSAPSADGGRDLSSPALPYTAGAIEMDADDSDESRSMLHAARKSGRRLLGPDGTLYNVFELDWAYDRRGRTLVFESDHAVRRVRTYPPHWRELPDEELYAVSWRR